MTFIGLVRTFNSYFTVSLHFFHRILSTVFRSIGGGMYALLSCYNEIVQGGERFSAAKKLVMQKFRCRPTRFHRHFQGSVDKILQEFNCNLSYRSNTRESYRNPSPPIDICSSTLSYFFQDSQLFLGGNQSSQNLTISDRKIKSHYSQSKARLKTFSPSTRFFRTRAI